MFETLASFAFTEHLCGALFDPALGPPEYPRVVSPERRPYRTSDGYLAVMIYTDQHWRAFFDAIGNPDWSRDPIFATITSRTRNIGAVLGRLIDVLASRTNDEWMALLTDAQVPAMPIKSLEDLLDDPHLADAGFWVERSGNDGRMRFPAIPTDFSETPGEIGDPGPSHGADGEGVLLHAGFSPEAIADMRASGALVGC
jgi:crotonobetainyl-CoA:carnitine CoA-transferase CaiB-like acyl-CoA transferase